MDNFNLDDIKNKCLSSSKHRDLTVKDFKVVYYLWNDKDVSKTKIRQELKRDKYTLDKIDKFIQNYLMKNVINLEEINDKLFGKILNAYINK